VDNAATDELWLTFAEIPSHGEEDAAIEAAFDFVYLSFYSKKL